MTDERTDDEPSTDAEPEPSMSPPADLTDGDGADGGDPTEQPTESDDGGRDVARLLNYLLLAGLTLFAFVAAVQFYLNAAATIGRWVAPDYRSAFQAVFNLAVLLVAVAGASRQLDRVR
ncbi:MAG: hypothetical protein ABEJ79_08730 [Halolamina sp.]